MSDTLKVHTRDCAVWASLPVPTFLIGADNVIVDVNSAAEGFVNTSRKSMIGKSIWQQITIEEKIELAFEKSRAQGTPLFVNDLDVGSRTRAPLQCSVQISPVYGHEGAMLLMLSPRELAGRMTQNHSAKSAAQSAIGMAEMLAHEIKNPLAGITGAAQLLSMNIAAEDLELTELIVSESRRIVKLLEQVEQFGNLSEPDFQPVNLHDVLDRARRSALLGFGSHMKIIEKYDPSLPPAWGDPDQLLQIVLNLLKNASQAAGTANGTITIRTYFEHSFRLRRSDGTGKLLPLQIEVVDDGPGLPSHIKDDIFEPFVSGRENGTGLGLALVSKIISDHDGWISVKSEPGRTVFRLSLSRIPREYNKKAGAN